MAIQFSNLASTTLASGVSSSATSVSVTSASSFPTLGSGDYFYATIGAGSGSEIVKVTGISGTTFTVLRGQDDTTAVSHSSGADVALRVTAGALADLRDGGQVYTAGSGLGLADNEFTNTAPDQTVALTGAGTTSVSGTYPNFTITGAGTTYTAGSGLSLTGTEFANTAPDQTVALTGAGATSISGTYPNFTITSTDTVYTHPSAHSISFITGLQTALDAKVDDGQVLTNVPSGALFTDTNTVYTHPSAHSISFITGLQTALDGKVDDSQVLTNVPANALFTDTNTVYTHPSAHAISFITGLQTALDGKVDDSQVLTNVPSGALFTDTVYTLPSGYATETYVGNQITALVDSSPATMDTLNELAAALGDDPNFATTVSTSIGTKWTQDNTKISQWNTAYGWGNHASAGYDVRTASVTLSGLKTFTNAAGIKYSGAAASPLWLNRSSGTNVNIRLSSSSGTTYVGQGASAGTLRVGTTADLIGSGKEVWHYGNLPTTSVANWNTAYGWGNHASAGYLTSYTDTNTTYSIQDGELSQNNFTNADHTKLNGIAIGANNYTLPFTNNSANWNTAYGWGNHASGNYIAKGSEVASGAVWTTATRFGSVGQLSQGAGNHSLSVRSENGNDAFMSFHIGGDYAVHFGMDGTSNRLHVGGWSDGTGTQHQIYDSRDGSAANWNTAYGWGNHASAGYLTSFTETNAFIGDGGTGSTHPSTNRGVYTGQLSQGSAAVGMPTTDNSNSILTFNRHSGNYNSQIGFSSNSNMYYRSFSNVAINSTQAWRKVYDSGNFTDNSANWNTAYGWGNHASAGYYPASNPNGYTSNVGDITGVTAGTGLTGGGSSGTPTLNVIGGSGITANANDIVVDSTVIRTTGSQSMSGTKTFTGSVVTPILTMTTTQNRTKLRVWNDSTYGMGMHSAHSFGGLNDYAMTFQMNNDSDRGFWWGDDAHTNAQGAMSLTTNGKLSVASGIRVGYGETDTTSPAAGLAVNGTASFAGVIDANGGHGGINITSSSILSSATSTWTGNPGGAGKIQYHSNRWYIVSDSSSNRIVQFRRDGADKSYIDNNGTFIGNVSGSVTGSVTGSSGSCTGNAATSTTSNMSAGRTDSASYPILWGTTGSQSQLYSATACKIRSSDGTIFSTSLRGSGNVSGTGEATHHPAGVYSTGTNWLYGTINQNGNTIISNGGITSTGVISTSASIRADAIYSNNDGSSGYFYNDSGTRTAYAGGDFYLQTSVANYYNYATNIHLGNTSGDTVRFRGNTVIHNGFTFNSSGDLSTSRDIVSSARSRGVFGSYSSTLTDHIWSMGTGYRNHASGTNFGNLYGLAYKHTNNSTGGTMAGGHMMVWCQNGTPNAAMGSNIWTSGNVTAYSDIRVKTNIEHIPDALDKVCQLNGYTFDRTDVNYDDKGEPDKPIRQTGVIAQEVLEVLPEAVTGDEEGHYSVAYGNMVGLLIESIKELKAEVDDLKAQLEAK